MSVLDRLRRWLDRAPAADPSDLRSDPPEDPAAGTGLDRPLPSSGPIADPPVGDPPPAQPPDRPLG